MDEFRPCVVAAVSAGDTFCARIASWPRLRADCRPRTLWDIKPRFAPSPVEIFPRLTPRAAVHLTGSSRTDESSQRLRTTSPAFELLKVAITLVLNRSDWWWDYLLLSGTLAAAPGKRRRDLGDSQGFRSHFSTRSRPTSLNNAGRHPSAASTPFADHAPLQEIEQLWQDYLKTVNAWNTKWNLYRALVLEEFRTGYAEGVSTTSKAMPKEYGQKASLTAKLIIVSQQGSLIIIVRRPGQAAGGPETNRGAPFLDRPGLLLFLLRSHQTVFKRVESANDPGRQLNRQK